MGDGCSSRLYDNILYVGGSGPGNYTSIQEAINDAVDGDTIFVYSGVYHEDIIINKSISLIGEDKDTIIIYNGSRGFFHEEVIHVISNNVVISGFTVENIMDYGRGVKLDGAENCRIENTCIRDNGYGISLVDSTNCGIIDNIVIRNYQEGISVDTSTSCIVVGNLVKDNEEGIYITSSSSCIISSNLVYKNSYGIELISSYNCSITSNTIIEGGVFLHGSSIEQLITHRIDTNTVNGKPVYYLKNINNESISSIDVGEVILVNCSDLEIGNIDISDATVGIEILYSSGVDIVDTYLNYSSVDIYYSDRIGIYNSKILGNGRDSVSFYHSDNNSIYNTIILGGSYGISFTSSMRNSIRNCDIHSNRYTCVAFSQSSENSMYKCVMTNDAECIMLFSYSIRNSFKSCRISSRYSFGVYLEDFSDGNKFYRCNISDSLYGVFLGLSHDNKFLENNFIGNLEDVYFYNSFLNTWFRNYWSNWIGLLPKPLKGCIYTDFDINLHIPVINFDWHPARKPYDIGGGMEYG